MKRFLKIVTLWCCLALSTTLSFGQSNPKLASDLEGLLNSILGPLDLVIQYNSTPGLLQRLELTALGGVITNQYSSIPAISVRLPAGGILGVLLDPLVSYVSLDRQVTGTLDLTTAASNANYAFQSGYTGAGVGIAILDSGIYNHPDLASRVVYRQSFVPSKSLDDYGHGTHVAGIAAGNGAASGGLYRGVAPGAKLIDLRILDANGMSSDSVVIAAIDRAIALKNQYNIRVINLSIGRPIQESYNRDPLCAAVTAAWKKGIVVVVAAGNFGRNGYATVTSPGNDPYVITVGAMKTESTPQRSDDLIASYSSKGPTWIDFTVKPDIVAPGNLVTSLLAPGSTLAREFPGNISSPSYIRLSGTSMATPVVSGAAAILLQKDPSLTPDTIKARLMKTAGKTFPLTSIAVDSTTGAVYPSTYDIFTVGAGYLDIEAALNNRDGVSGVALSPTVYWSSLSSTAMLLKASSSTWDNNTWSLKSVWGPQVVQSTIGGTSAAWGTAAAWGSSAAWGTSAAWGASAAWGTSAAWGSSTTGTGER